jgi:formate-dependent nitrite reductase membrane component NrfD
MTMPAELQPPMWTWWIILYFFFGGVAGGAYFLAAVIELVGSPEDRPIARMGYYIAFPLSILCAILLIVDLGVPGRFWHMVIYSNTLLPTPNWISPMSVGSYALLFFGLFSFLSFLDALVETGRLPWAPLREKYSGAPRLVYAVVGALFGFFLTAYTGVLVTTTQFPIWNTTPLLGALFAVSGAATGMAAIGLGLSSRKIKLTGGLGKLRQTDLVAIVFETLLLIVFLAWLGKAALPLVTGIGGLMLIGGVLILGMLAPLVLQLLARPAQDRHAGFAWLSFLLTLLGGLLLRAAIVLGGQGYL